MPGCGIIIPAEAKAQKMTLEILCYLANKVDDLQATVLAMHEDQLTLKAEAQDVLERHRQAAEEYFASFPDPCGEEGFDPCPFASLPVGTKRRDLDRGDQPKQADYVVDIAERGNWLVQHHQDDMTATKPPLYNWLAADLSATDRTHVFVFGHEPAYVQPDADNGRVRHLGDSLDQHPAHRDRFWNLLRDERVVAYICGHTHNYSAVEIDGVWQLDAGHARGRGDSGARSTFIMINVDASGVTFRAYRDDANGGPYALAHTGILRQCVAGYDLDCDCDVDVNDIMLVAGHWHSSAGDADYDPVYDLDDDGDIDIVDIMLVAVHWGETC